MAQGFQVYSLSLKYCLGFAFDVVPFSGTLLMVLLLVHSKLADLRVPVFFVHQPTWPAVCQFFLAAHHFKSPITPGDRLHEPTRPNQKSGQTAVDAAGDLT